MRGREWGGGENEMKRGSGGAEVKVVYLARKVAKASGVDGIDSGWR